jgi:hypothetical protein
MRITPIIIPSQKNVMFPRRNIEAMRPAVKKNRTGTTALERDLTESQVNFGWGTFRLSPWFRQLL